MIISHRRTCVEIVMSKEPSSKRQKLAEEQFKKVEESSQDEFRIFMQEYSHYIPFQTLSKVVNANKNLRLWFNEFATNIWWQTRVKNDFFDFYYAIVNPDGQTFDEYIIAWLKETIRIHEHLWDKPWRLIYMVCYGMYTMINNDSTSLSIDNFMETQFFDLSNESEDIATDMILVVRETEVNIFSWITGKIIASFDTSPNIIFEPIRNGYLFISGNDDDVFYNRETDSIITLKGSRFVDRAPMTSEHSDLLVQAYSEIGLWTIWHKDYPEKPFYLQGPAYGNVHLIKLNFYEYQQTIFEWPHKRVQTVGAIPNHVFGPYNFIEPKFSSMHTLNGVDFFKTGTENAYMTAFGWSPSVTTEFSSGFVLLTEDKKKERIVVPTGRSVSLKTNIEGEHIRRICGPFMLFTLDGGGTYRTIDLWTALQKRRKEPIEFVSSRNCHSCGFIASIECNSCESTFCSDVCARKNLDVSKCKHNSIKG